MNWFPNAWTALRMCEIIALIGVIVVHLEWIMAGRKLHENGLGDWRVLSLRFPGLVRKELDQSLGALMGWRGMRIVSLAQVVSALALLLVLPFGSMAHTVILFGVVLGGMLVSARNAYGMDGADQMLQIVLFSVAVASLTDSPLVSAFACWFIALQLSLSYLTAGIAKLSARTWRDGSALPRVLRTETYGLAPVGEFLRVNPRVAHVACLGIILLQCGFVLAFVIPPAGGYVLLTLGLVFHISNAAIMGLNNFLLAFMSPYPALLWCLGQVHLIS